LEGIRNGHVLGEIVKEDYGMEMNVEKGRVMRI
jgi:hypothetical protein